MTATETLSRIHKISTGKADADVSAMSCCTKIADMATHAFVEHGDRIFSTIIKIALCSTDAVTRMEAIAALCAQAGEKVAA